MNILLTGFGPFPGAPLNPTAALVEKLSRSRKLAGVRRTAHVFRTSYETVDRELPLVMARANPDVLMMFGLALRSRHVRIETRARNALSDAVPDAVGVLPDTGMIAPGARIALRLRSPAQQLLQAAHTAGVPAVLSCDAGSYLCNYLCWRATEATTRARRPKVAAFVHVPPVRDTNATGALTLTDLLRASEAMVRAAIAAARTAR